jgi:predicted transcriptional regulator
MSRDDYYPEDQSFYDKWSICISNDGFTMIPNVLLENAHVLGITPSELVVLINIESHRWGTRLPYPSVQRLAKRTGMSERHITRLITSLERKKLIWRQRRKSKTNEYDISPLITKLDIISTESLPDHADTTSRQNEHIVADIFDAEIPTSVSAKEDTFKQDPIKHTQLNNISHIKNNIRVVSLDNEKSIGGMK